MLFLLAGCGKSEFSIQFQFPKDHIGNYIVDYYAWDSKKGSWIESVASVQNGVADVKCAAGRPTIIYIRDVSTSNSIAIYAERGDKIVISGDKSDMNTWTVKGNKISENWSHWRNKNADVLTKSRGEFTDGKKKAISDFVKANKDDKLSTLVLLTDWNRFEDPDGFLRLWNMIDKNAKPKQLIEMAGCADLLGVEFEVDADGKLTRTKGKKLKQIIVRTDDNGTDTLQFAKAKASLLFFYKEKGSERDEAIDSLKVLVKAYPDSAKRIICHVGLMTDSVVWRTTMRRDSIKNVVKAWVPLGLVDRDLVSLGVTRAPWYVVIKKDGSDVYSGSSLKDATSAFRKEMDSKSPSQKKKS